ncbi:MAG: PspC domain-containing protein [Alistipes sp.]|nr:PspC domain-containing protein [Alistipes sp.]
MKEVKKCSISGVAFTMDADAYETLGNYLESLRKAYKDSPDGTEIVADIEARIAELILSAQDNERVVELPLVLNIIRQLGSTAEITDTDADADLQPETPRIPRRLYRDPENAKLGGVCAGIGKYFDIDPVWVRLAMFLPLLFVCMGGFPFIGHWMSQLFSNLFGIFLICYFIMWFAVPTARTARQKLEMNGEQITVHSVASTTAAGSADVDTQAKSIVAEAVSLFGKVVLALLKLFAGLLVFGLILSACGLIIGLFAIAVGGHELLNLNEGMTLAVPILGTLIALIAVMLLIYVLMCLIASRKPSGKTLLAIFLLWIATVIACACVAIRENLPDKIGEKRREIRRMLQTEVEVDGESTSLEELLERLEEGSVTENGEQLRISVPSKSLDITVDKQQSQVKVTADGKVMTIRADVQDEAPEE